MKKRESSIEGGKKEKKKDENYKNMSKQHKWDSMLHVCKTAY